jgi:hypothetical protein
LDELTTFLVLAFSPIDMYNQSYGSRVPLRHQVVYIRERSLEDLKDVNWKLRWPFLISTLIGLVLIVFSLVIFSLEIASLAQSTDTVDYNGQTYGRTASTGAGIWCGFFIFLAGLLIVIIGKEKFLNIESYLFD